MNDRIRVQRKKGFSLESNIAQYSNFNSEESGLHRPLEVNEVDQSQMGDPEMKDSDEILKNKIMSHGSGQEIEPEIQQQLNSRFGHSFAQVRVHTDSEGDQLARSVDATAFTTGQDIFYRQGTYDPTSPQGMGLLVHEAAHTIQQAEGPVQIPREPSGVYISNPGDPAEREAESAVASTLTTTSHTAQQPLSGSSISSGRSEATGILVDILRQPYQTGATTTIEASQPQPSQATMPEGTSSSGGERTPDPNEIWEAIETRATPELLIKLQEIGAAAGEEAKQQLESLFGPYEDSLASDQTFASVATMAPWAAAGAVGGAGIAAAALGGAGAQGAGTVMSYILNSKDVGEAKEKARSDVGNLVRTRLSSSSDLYSTFEAEALAEMRTEFDQSWNNIPPVQRSTPEARQLMLAWFPRAARQKYGIDSPTGRQIISAIRDEVANSLAPVKSHLDELQADHDRRRILVGAGSVAVSGAIIGAMIAGPLGALIGGVAGGIGGGVAGWLW